MTTLDPRIAGRNDLAPLAVTVRRACETTVWGEMPASWPMASKGNPLATRRSSSVSRSVSGDGAAGAPTSAAAGFTPTRKRASTRRAMPGLMGEPPARSSWMLAAMRSDDASFSR